MKIHTLLEFSDFPAVLLLGPKSLILWLLVNDKNSLPTGREGGQGEWLIVYMDTIF